ncbi:MAG: hypothetical protein ABJE47_08895 [bacterium]
MPLLSPQSLIITSRALAGVGLTPEEVRWDAKTLERATDAEGPPSWDARFIHVAGFWSHYNHKSRTSAWPFPTDLTTPELGMFGMHHNVLYQEPMAGDIFLQWNVRVKTFVHSGVVVDVEGAIRVFGRKPAFDLYTVEGDTNEFAQLRGGKCMRVQRRLSAELGDRFLRWEELRHEGARRLGDPRC